MSQTDDSRPQPSADGPTPGDHPRPSGRYRFRDGQPADPNEGVHPEMRTDGAGAMPNAKDDPQTGLDQAIPSSPAELIAMQDKPSPPRPEKPERQTSPKVSQIMDLIDQLDTNAAEDLDLAFRLVRRLENFHDEVVEEMRNDIDASHHQLISWAIDADRLMQARILLGHVDLE